MKKGWFSKLITSEYFGSGSLEILSIAEVAEKLKLKDLSAARRWLEAKNIKIYRETKTHYVYAIDVDCAVDKNWVLDLKSKYPNDWQSIYRNVAVDPKVCEMLLFELQGVITLPISNVKLESEKDVELFKKLVG